MKSHDHLIRGVVMNRRFALKGGTAIVSMVFLLAALIGVSTQDVVAQRPELPTLSLTGTQ